MVNIENENEKLIRLPVLPRPRPAYKAGASLICQAGMRLAEVGGHAPHPANAERSAFETVPARSSGSASRKNWSPATGMLRAQQIKSLLHHFNACGGMRIEIGNPSGTRTRFACLRGRIPTHRRTGHLERWTMAEASGDAPQPTHRRGPSGFQPAAARWSALASVEKKWQPRMDLHHQPSASEAGALLLSYGAIGNGSGGWS